MSIPFKTLRPIVLASGSPRRRAFLQGLGIPFEVIPADCPEPRPIPGEDPREYTLRTAEAKASHVYDALARRGDRPVVLAADTSVILREGDDAVILGKPEDRDDAVAMLSRLSGRTHQVVTACCIATDEGEDLFDDVTDVTFAPWPRSVLEAYADSGDPLDKAGAYGIQDGGAFLVQGIRGSWSTVVGLPLDKVLEHLIKAGALALND